MGARSMAMGQTGVAIPEDNWTIFSNVALMETEQNQVSFYGFRYLGISEITDMAVSLNYQTKWGTFGTGIHRYGFNLFNENRMRIAYKNNLSKFHYGVAVNYTHVFQGENYGSAGAFGIDLGIGAQVVDALWIGARATNLNQPAYGSTDEELPREMAIGLSYKLASRALFTSELVKDVRFPMSYRMGVEFEMIESLFARAGTTTEPETYSFGFGYSADRWLINVAMQQHIPLGLSPALDLGLRF
ncbi:MAG: hypothetical protein WEA58_06775 [Balneolaceae bacterium]